MFLRVSVHHCGKGMAGWHSSRQLEPVTKVAHLLADQETATVTGTRGEVDLSKTCCQEPVLAS